MFGTWQGYGNDAPNQAWMRRLMSLQNPTTRSTLPHSLLPYKKSTNQGPVNVLKGHFAELRMDVVENEILAFALIEYRRVLNVRVIQTIPLRYNVHVMIDVWSITALHDEPATHERKMVFISLNTHGRVTKSCLAFLAGSNHKLPTNCNLDLGPCALGISRRSPRPTFEKRAAEPAAAARVSRPAARGDRVGRWWTLCALRTTGGSRRAGTQE